MALHISKTALPRGAKLHWRGRNPWGWCAIALLAIGFGNAAAGSEPGLTTPLVTAPINPRERIVLTGNTRPEAIRSNDRGALPDGFVLDHLLLQLQRTPAREAAVAAYVNALTEPGSPTYRQWLTAEEFGARFGTAAADIDKITGWLQSEGFRVNFVYPGRMVIDFSGTAGLISRAFQTEIHRLDVGGVGHIANMSDPRVPAALAPAVAGIVSLNDFRPQKQIARQTNVTGCTAAASCYAFGPGDLATIYDLAPVFQQGNTGQGNVLAAVEDSDLYSTADWVNFRKAFGLRKYTSGTLTTIHPAPAGGKACADPGVTGSDDEATLDAEWASAAAPSATIEIASCADTQTTYGVLPAIQNLVNGSAPPPVISVSYGACEALNGATANAAFNSVYQQAAAEGISVFVSSGDDGPSGCSPHSNKTIGTQYGIGANGWAVSQYNVSVGGTDFGDTYEGTTARYWRRNQGPPYASALSYIPEIAWNATCGSPLIAAYAGFTASYGSGGYCNSKAGAVLLAIAAGSGAPSGCYSGAPSVAGEVSGTCKAYPKPSWQTGVMGIPTDGVRDQPDIAMFASNGPWLHSLATCFTDPNNGGKSCAGNPAGWANAGGTSYATPIMAAIQLLIDARLGGALGNPAPVYYKLASTEYGAKGNPSCYSTQGSGIGSTCIFHDVVTIGSVADGIEMDCVTTYNCYRPSGTYGVMSTVSTAYKPSFSTGIGYDLATGLGSVDAYNLVNQYP